MLLGVWELALTRTAAVEDIKDNPVSSVKRPKISTSNVEVYNEDEVTLLIKALNDEPIHLENDDNSGHYHGFRPG